MSHRRPPPPPRRRRWSTMERVRRMSDREHFERYDPERVSREPRYARPHHFAVNTTREETLAQMQEARLRSISDARLGPEEVFAMLEDVLDWAPDYELDVWAEKRTHGETEWAAVIRHHENEMSTLGSGGGYSARDAVARAVASAGRLMATEREEERELQFQEEEAGGWG